LVAYKQNTSQLLILEYNNTSNNLLEKIVHMQCSLLYFDIKCYECVLAPRMHCCCYSTVIGSDFLLQFSTPPSPACVCVLEFWSYISNLRFKVTRLQGNTHTSILPFKSLISRYQEVTLNIYIYIYIYFIQQGCIKLIKSDRKDVYIVNNLNK